MRLHHLEVTAFGPFSGAQTVDFDSLTDAGLFLLCGPTGAGKTSILDAVCFGLYGEVPGDRNSAKRLRSDHAAPGTAPSVLLETSINGRRFKIRRSPAWNRPKRRGTGTTTEQARVTLEESVDGEWVHLSSRLDETAHVITELLGMNVTQFTQVAMLPQGRFQSFLRARSDERHKVLQRLFRTSRFEDIEKWLVAHRQSLKAATKGHQDAVGSVVSRLSEAADAELPDGWELHELALPAENGEVAAWASDLLTAAAAAQDSVAAELDAAGVHARQARGRLEEARALLGLRARHSEAEGRERSLEASREEAEESRRRLVRARHASAVTPLLKVATTAATQAATAQRGLARVLADAAARLGAESAGLSHDDLAAAEQQAKESAAIAKTLLPREADLKSAQRVVESTTAALEKLRLVLKELEAREEAIPGQLDEWRDQLTERISRAAGLEAAASAERQLRERLVAAHRLVDLHAETSQAQLRLRESTDVAQSLRERVQDVREARISGMAAELAAALASGDSCPVCGSPEHPEVARPVDGAPTKADEEAARTAYEDADFTRQAAAEAVATLERNVALAEQAAGGQGVDDLERELAEALTRRDSCEAALAEKDRLTGRIHELDKELADVRERLQETRAETAGLEQERAQAQSAVERVSAELAALFDDEGVTGSVERLIEAKTRAGSVFAAAREALLAHEAAVARVREADEHALECALEHGFESSEAAAAAAIGKADVESLEAALRSREHQQAQARAVLSDPDVRAAVAAETPDIAGLEEATRSADDQLTAVGARARVLERRTQRLEMLRSELTRELTAWEPTRSAYSVAHAVSTFAEGKGGDNALQMRLSAYVLASRLEQVVAAANERLCTMSDERYTLEHSAKRGVGELRGGLSLMVRDEWTGESRDPATLSGGETFVVSLALALGLADVVTGEAGGSSIDTLFIDEGFGSLDPETLDDVMNTLDGLRDGGRVVGIVSHVPEMRTRITSQLQVRKDRTGSRVLAAREVV